MVVETANLSAGTGAVGAALEGLERALQASRRRCRSARLSAG
ncbi:hypothetical protein [Nannocystis pusilla]